MNTIEVLKKLQPHPFNTERKSAANLSHPGKARYQALLTTSSELKEGKAPAIAPMPVKKYGGP
jgi:hypothetical protein